MLKREKPLAGAEWMHEIKHDGHRLIVRRGRDGAPIHAERLRLVRALPGADTTSRVRTVRRGRRVDADRRALPIRRAFGMDQGAESGERYCAAGAEREREQVSVRTEVNLSIFHH